VSRCRGPSNKTNTNKNGGKKRSFQRITGVYNFAIRVHRETVPESVFFEKVRYEHGFSLLETRAVFRSVFERWAKFGALVNVSRNLARRSQLGLSRTTDFVPKRTVTANWYAYEKLATVYAGRAAVVRIRV